MKRLMLGVAVLAGLAAIAPQSASAWTHCGTAEAEDDCPPITACVDGVTKQVPDNGAYQPGECPPVTVVTVCSNGETITVPEDQVPPGSTPGECEVVPPPPPPPVPPPPPTPPTPPTPPATVTVCRDGETIQVPADQVLDTDSPDSCPAVVEDDAPADEGEGHTGTPIKVIGKEQGNSPETANPTETGSNLPFTGAGISPLVMLFAGLPLLLLGRRFRKGLEQ